MGRVKKARRKRNAELAGYLLDGGAPAPWNAVLLPGVDRLNAAISLALALAPELFGDGFAATKAVDQGSMFVLHDSDSNQKIFGLVKPLPSVISFDDDPKKFWQHQPWSKGALSMAFAEDDQISPAFKVEAGRRLRQIRLALGHEELRQFAIDTSTDDDNLGNWERGVSLVPAWYVDRLRRLLGATSVDHN